MMNGLKIKHGMLVLIGFSLLFAGCSGTQLKSSQDATRTSTPAVQDENSPRYYDFVDILIPGELKLDNRATFIVQVSGFATGVLVLDGRVKRDSLINFFQTNMKKDNWDAISFFKSPRSSSFLLYRKSNRWCVICIRDKDFTTQVEIGVSPAGEGSPAGLYK